MPHVKDPLHPRVPSIIEASVFMDGEMASPVHRVEGFTEVNLNDNGGGFSGTTTPEKVRCMDDVLIDASAAKETRLISIDTRVDSRMDSCRTLVIAFMSRFWMEMRWNC